MSRPDFRTINRFRSERLCDGRFEELFRQTVVMMNGEGLVSLKVQYIDGTKIESVANKYTFVWKGSVEKNKARLEAKIDAVLKAAESVLEEENGECSAEEPCVEDLPERTERILRKMDERGEGEGRVPSEARFLRSSSGDHGREEQLQQDGPRRDFHEDEGGRDEQRADQARLQCPDSDGEPVHNQLRHLLETHGLGNDDTVPGLLQGEIRNAER